MSDIVSFIRNHDCDERLNEFIKQRKKHESIVNALNEEIYMMCKHKWVNDIIENPYTEQLTHITYCQYCESNKR